MYTPASYQVETPAPMLVSLHGLGEIGDDLGKLTSTGFNPVVPRNPAWLIAQSQWPVSRPFIVVSPQLKPDGTGDNQDWDAITINEVIEHVKEIRSIDANRIYLTGLSLGGQGCFIYAAAYPDKVAAMVPLCGRTDEILNTACSLIDIPTWAFHGKEDLRIVPDNSIDMIEAINACNPTTIKPHLSLVEATRHEAGFWDPIYDLTSGANIYDWLLKFSKNNTANKSPYVSAGVDRKVSISGGSTYLVGDYFDADGEVTAVQWIQTSGPAALTLENLTEQKLKISNLQIGTFEFELRVWDDQNAESWDKVQIHVVASPPPVPPLPSNSHQITALTLINGTTNTNLFDLQDGQSIFKNTLGVTEFNIRATTTNGGMNGNSVKFRINENQNTRVVSASNSSNIILITNSFPTEWRPSSGEYTVCATPYGSLNAVLNEGFTRCYNLFFYNQYFPKPTLDVSLLTTWGSGTDGSGLPPASFTDGFQIFNVNSTVVQNSTWSVSGDKTILNIISGGELTLNDNFTGVVNIEGTGIVNINTNQPVSIGSVAPTSTIRFGTQATQIPSATYGNIVLQGSPKILPAGTVSIVGNLTVENGATLDGPVTGINTLQVAGHLSLAEPLNPTRKFNLTLTGTQQNLTVNTLAAFNQLNVLATTNASLVAQDPATLELGSASGGGLLLEANSELLMHQNTLRLSGQGVSTLAPTAQVGFSKGNVVYNSSSTESTLRTKVGADSIRALLVNGAGQLTISNMLFVLDSIKISNGALHSNGVTLVSTADQTARLAAFAGTGNLTGSVNFQRYIRSGRMYRYLAFPVSGVSVDSLQEYLPVTGNFTGASEGPGLTSANPSLFRYTNNQWVPYPTTDSAVLFAVGTGYSAFMRNETEPFTFQVTGPIHRGDFEFTLQPGSSDQDEGWSLLGNPYAAPLQWDGSWNASGIGTAVYVRDNESENGRILIWDGGEGDAEFGGKIAQGQSFWVKGLTTTPMLTVTESGKTTTGNFFRTNTSPKPAAAITLARGGLIDRAYVKYSESASVTFDATTDAHKLKNTTHNLSLVSTDDVLASIKSMPDSCTSTIGLAVEDLPAGSYMVSVSGTALDNRVFDLVDLFQDTTVTLMAQTGYPFTVTAEAASYGKRFQLITQSTLANPELTLRGDTLFTTATTGLQWLFNGTPIAGASASYWVARQAGLYQVQAQQGGCVKQSAPVMFAITHTKHEPLSVHPNPTQNQVSVNGLTKRSSFTIHDMHGRPLQTGMISPDQNLIDINLLAGFYILSIHEAPTQRIKLIVK